MLSLVYHNFLEKNISAFNAVKEGATQGEKYCKSLIGYFNAHGNGTTQDFLKDISFFKKENKQNTKKKKKNSYSIQLNLSQYLCL